MKELREAKSVEELMLVEARCRQLYYESFNEILNDKDFSFTTRTRQPPCDPINTLISFGNTLLYNRIQQIIWKTSLDPRIGIVHASGNRNLTLNLDFADLFKPIITDRVIFTLINKHQLKSGDFVNDPSGGVRLGNDGKKLFIKTFEEKMRNTLTIKERKLSYHQLIESEIRNYMEHLLKGAKYKPYKYY